jgi:hypothetical protein
MTMPHEPADVRLLLDANVISEVMRANPVPGVMERYVQHRHGRISRHTLLRHDTERHRSQALEPVRRDSAAMKKAPATQVAGACNLGPGQLQTIMTER